MVKGLFILTDDSSTVLLNIIRLTKKAIKEERKKCHLIIHGAALACASIFWQDCFGGRDLGEKVELK